VQVFWNPAEASLVPLEVDWSTQEATPTEAKGDPSKRSEQDYEMR
jgi:hypothetical protein